MKRNNPAVSAITLVIFSVSLLLSYSAYADIYRCDSTPGVVTLTNQPKGNHCKKMVLPPPDKPSNNPATKAKPETADANTKSSKYKAGYDNAVTERKRIIREEVDLERERLDAVNDKLNKLSAIKTKSPAQTAEFSALQKKQALHQGNLDLLQKELNKQ
jgi:hypothetical protein